MIRRVFAGNDKGPATCMQACWTGVFALAVTMPFC